MMKLSKNTIVTTSKLVPSMASAMFLSSKDGSKAISAGNGGSRGAHSDAVRKHREAFKNKNENANRLFLADEGLGYARSWAEDDSDKITATMVGEVDFKSRNYKYLKSKNATIIGGVNPTDLKKCDELKGKNYNTIHINMPDPNIMETVFKETKPMLRGFGEVQVLADVTDKEAIDKKATLAGLILKRDTVFEENVFPYYTPPAAAANLNVLHYRVKPVKESAP